MRERPPRAPFPPDVTRSVDHLRWALAPRKGENLVVVGDVEVAIGRSAMDAALAESRAMDALRVAYAPW
jgi:hypothetical protein